MIHLNIKSQFAGCGKSYLLAKLFVKANLPNKVILVPTNKCRQVMLNKLSLFSNKNFESSVLTMMKFKKNYIIEKINGEEFYRPCQTRTKTWKKFYNVFIDEYSMMSKFCIDDLVKNVPIQNIVTAGDILQFSPIPVTYVLADSKNELLKDNGGVDIETLDPGAEADLNIDHQIVLQKQMRSFDSQLNDFIRDIKNGNGAAICKIIQSKITDEEPEYEKSQCIAYTKRVCNDINSKIEKPHRFIVRKNDTFNDLYKGEIYSDGYDPDFPEDESYLRYQYILKNQKLHFNDVTLNSKGITFESWHDRIFKPAYAINAHKLQGETIIRPLYIYLDDIVYLFFLAKKEELNSKKFTNEERAEAAKSRLEKIALFQKFLYVAVTRATKFDNIHFVFKNHGKANDLVEILKSLTPMKEDFEDFAIYDDSDTIDVDYWLSKLAYEVPPSEIEAWKTKWRHTAYCNREIDYDNRKIDYKNRKPKTQIADNTEAVKDAKTMSFKEWNAKWNKSKPTWIKLKKM